jgi:hypothetical protein
MAEYKRDFSQRTRKYWVKKFKGYTLTSEGLCEKINKDLQSKMRLRGGGNYTGVDKVLQSFAEIVWRELEEQGEFVLQGVGRFYLLHGKSGQSFIKFSSKYK